MIEPLLLSDIAMSCQGELIGKDLNVSSVSTDSRSISQGELFIALQGERFDGHEYLQKAIDQGASAVLVDSGSKIANQLIKVVDTDTTSFIKVADTLKALGSIGKLNRSKFNGSVVGITGSAGKTTTKEMVAAILSRQGNTLYTKDNFNNEVGVPKTLLSIDDSHRYAVIEMGAARVGDIAYLSDFVQPDISVLTNAAEAHIQGFGSLDGVAQGKSEIYQSLGSNGAGILNIDDHYSSGWKSVVSQAGAKLVSVSLNNKNADVYASDVQETDLGSHFTLHIKGKAKKVELSIPGLYNIKNALMAAGVADQLNIDITVIASALSNFSGTKGRMQSVAIGNLTILDDTYNANPKAMKAALDVLSKTSSYQIAILGGMGELGENNDLYHQDIIKHVEKAQIDAVYCFGDTWPEISSNSTVSLFKTKDQLAEKLLIHLADLMDKNKTITVLVKGSRSMKMETFVELLTHTYKLEKAEAN